jgi:hypothetical protein
LNNLFKIASSIILFIKYQIISSSSKSLKLMISLTFCRAQIKNKSWTMILKTYFQLILIWKWCLMMSHLSILLALIEISILFK